MSEAALDTNTQVVVKTEGKRTAEEAFDEAFIEPLLAPPGKRPAQWILDVPHGLTDGEDAWPSTASSPPENQTPLANEIADQQDVAGVPSLIDERNTAEQIKLRVGNSMFYTTMATLLKSKFFARFFSYASNQQPANEGAYFVDADGDSFQHILSFLRHGAAPLFWTKQQGFDYGAYAKLRAQASYLEILELVEWIDQEIYRSVIKETLSCVSVIKQGFPDCISLNDRDVPSPGLDKRVAGVHLFNEEKYEEARYECPRDIREHKSAADCGKMCVKAAANKNTSGLRKEVGTITMTRVIVEVRDFVMDSDFLSVD